MKFVCTCNIYIHKVAAGDMRWPSEGVWSIKATSQIVRKSFLWILWLTSENSKTISKQNSLYSFCHDKFPMLLSCFIYLHISIIRDRYASPQIYFKQNNSTIPCKNPPHQTNSFYIQLFAVIALLYRFSFIPFCERV